MDYTRMSLTHFLFKSFQLWPSKKWQYGRVESFKPGFGFASHIYMYINPRLVVLMLDDGGGGGTVHCYALSSYKLNKYYRSNILNIYTIPSAWLAH